MKNKKKTMLSAIIYVSVAIATVILIQVLMDISKKEKDGTTQASCCLTAGGKWEKNKCTGAEQEMYQTCIGE